eukprot:7291770-Prymnesium_polylepis.1
MPRHGEKDVVRFELPVLNPDSAPPPSSFPMPADDPFRRLDEHELQTSLPAIVQEVREREPAPMTQMRMPVAPGGGFPKAMHRKRLPPSTSAALRAKSRSEGQQSGGRSS